MKKKLSPAPLLSNLTGAGRGIPPEPRKPRQSHADKARKANDEAIARETAHRAKPGYHIPKTALIHCAYNKILPAKSIKPHPKNMNEHPPEQVERIADILFGPKDAKGKRHGGQGWRVPVTVSTRSGFSIRGHGRVLAAKLAGELVPVEYQHYASEAAEVADLLADKRASEGSVWNIALAELGLDEMAQAGMEIELAGFDIAGVEALRAGPKLPAPGRGKNNGARGPGTPAIAYNLQFDTDEQQQKWFLFIRKLNALYPEAKTVGERLSLWIDDKGELE